MLFSANHGNVPVVIYLIKDFLIIIRIISKVLVMAKSYGI